MKSFFKIFCIVCLFLFSVPSFADNAKEGMRLFQAGKYQQAMTYFMKPDAQKNPDVLNRIAYMYDKGFGVEKNLQTSVKWYKKAAEMGFKVAQFNLGLSYQKGLGVPKDINEAIKWYRKSAGISQRRIQNGLFHCQGKRNKTGFCTSLEMVSSRC